MLAGISGSQSFVSCLLEMIDVGNARFPDDYLAVAGLSAGLYRSVIGLAFLMGPLYGSTVNEYIGFKLTMDILAFLDLAFVIAYFILSGGSEAI